MSALVTFLTDYGYVDEFAGACRAVLAGLAPQALVIDLTHGIPPGDVRRGGLALAASVPFPGPAVHLAVVDPGVGTERRAVAVAAADGSFLVGPDNGVLAPAIETLGGALSAADISRSALRLRPVAPTFHGRDIFAPVAAHLAAGRPLAVAGEEIDPAGLAPLDLPEPRWDGEDLVAHVLYADGFGNLVLDAAAGELADTNELALSCGDCEERAVRGATFADGAGGLVIYGDSSGRLGIALDGGSAAAALGAGRDDELRIAPA